MKPQITLPVRSTQIQPTQKFAVAPKADIKNIVSMFGPSPSDDGNTQYVNDPLSNQPTVITSNGLPPQAALGVIGPYLPKVSIWKRIARWLHIKV